MSRARSPLHIAGVLGVAMLMATGCGGDDAAATATDGATPTPGATDPLVADPGAVDPNAPVATDPVTGLPIDPAAAGASATTATVPDLVGDDVGGLSPVSNTALFDAAAVSTEDLPVKESEADKVPDATTGTDPGKDTTATTTTEKVTFSGAKIYVDGITHTVNINGTFPKGNPVFRLLSVTANDVEISLVAGEFTSSGGDGTFLDKGDLVSLVNASERVTYRVKYLRAITGTDSIAF